MNFSNNKKYKFLLKQLDSLYNDFNSGLIEFERFVNFEPQLMINTVKLFRQKLNNTFNSFVDLAKQKYQYIKDLYDKYYFYVDTDEEPANFATFAEENIELLFKRLPLTRKNSEEALKNFSFVKGCRIYNDLEQKLNVWEKLAKSNLRIINKSKQQENKKIDLNKSNNKEN